MDSIHNRYDPICSCPHCSQVRQEQITKLVDQKRKEEVIVENALKLQKQREDKPSC